MIHCLHRIAGLCLTTTAVLAAHVVPAAAQIADRSVDAIDDLQVTEHPGAELPLDLEFTDEDGNTVQLGDYLDGDRPVILTMNYYSCPMLCTLQLNGLIEALARLEWTPGVEFEMVTVSFDHRETPRLARLKKQTYIQEYQRPAAAAGWHFLTSSKDNAQQLADTLGFEYRYDPETNQYAHPAVTFVLTPDGRVSRYLYGVLYDPQTIRLSLVEAANGEIGSAMDQVLLFCFHYDPDAGRYSLAAFNIMRTGALSVLVALGAMLGVYWSRERRRRVAAEVPS